MGIVRRRQMVGENDALLCLRERAEKSHYENVEMGR